MDSADAERVKGFKLLVPTAVQSFVAIFHVCGLQSNVPRSQGCGSAWKFGAKCLFGKENMINQLPQLADISRQL